MKQQTKDTIFELIEPNTKILDLGCGSGNLLEQLYTEKKASGYGIEIDIEAVLTCTQKGISVFHGDIDEGLPEFSDQSFDYVILSQTMQQVKNPILVINEMLRIGKKAIITFPNFGHWQVRFQLLLFGNPPITKALPYDWYDTPNIRVITIKRFRHLCKTHNIKIIKEIPNTPFSNLFAKKGLFVIQKK